MLGTLSLRARLLLVTVAALLPLMAFCGWVAFRDGHWVHARDELYVAAAVVLLAIAAVWWLGGRMIVKPVKQLLGVARRIEQGHLEARLPAMSGGHRNEFARLGAAFNLMASSLQMRQADLEAELVRSRSAYAVLDQVLNSMQEGLVAVTRQGKFLLYNAAAARLVPLADAPVLPELWPEHFGVYHPEDGRLFLPEELPLVRAALGESEGQVLVLLRNALVPEGRLIQCTWRPMEGDSVQGGLVVYSDVTDLQRLEAERVAHMDWLTEAQHKNARLLGEVRELNASLETRIAERTEQLRAANEELEAFSYSVSHDLRAPLAAIAGFSQALESKVRDPGDERTQHYFARIQAGTRKMEELIEALLQLSRVTRAQLESADVDISALARETLENLRVQRPGRSVAVEVQDGLVARGDPRLLRAVIENLVGNAWKFTGAVEQPRVEVGRTEEGAFYVRDNGVGFDMAYADKLFTAFHRLHKESEFPGTGIGLATVRRIVTRHQGRVWAESRPGEGTTFYFTV